MALVGKITPPGDKSVSHRLALMPIISEGEICISGLSDCQDVLSSLACYKELGGTITNKFDGICLKGLNGQVKEAKEIDLDCGNSGTTMRLLSGILASIPGRFVLDGDAQLRRRPMERVAEPLRQMGAKIETNSGRPPIIIEGAKLHAIDYIFPTSSAQLKGAAIFAALMADGNSHLSENAVTRDHTERMVAAFGGRLNISGLKIEVVPSKLKMPEHYNTPSDPSASSFFLCGAAFIPDSQVTCQNILLSPGRIGFLRVLDRMGANVHINLEQEKPEPSGDVTVTYNDNLRGTEINEEEVPSLIDEVPILALTAAFAKGKTVFHGVGELRVKESDRLMAIKHQLGHLGVRVKIDCDDLIIEGPTKMVLPDKLDSSHDHRLAMMLYMALAYAGAERPIVGEESIAISYPNFLNDLHTLSK